MESCAHRLKAEFHQAEAIRHARLAELNLLAANICEERSRVQTDRSSRHEAYVKYKTAYEKMRAELDMLSRGGNSS